MTSPIAANIRIAYEGRDRDALERALAVVERLVAAATVARQPSPALDFTPLDQVSRRFLETH